MGQIPTQNDDDNHSVAASDFVHLDLPAGEVPAQEAQQQQEQQPQFGLNQNPLDLTMNTGSTSNYDNELKEHKLTTAKLEAKNQALEAKVENLELKAENRALKENAEQKASNQALKAEIMSELKDEFAKMLAEQRQQMMAQFQAQQNNSLDLEQKPKEAEQRAQMEKNEDKMKLDYIWGQLMIKGKRVVNPRGIVWDGSNPRARISEYGRKATSNAFCQWVFATEGYPISAEQCRKDNFPFPGTIVFYFEVTTTSRQYYSVGFTDGHKSAGAGHVGDSPNSYGLAGYDANHARTYSVWLSGKEHNFAIGDITQGYVVGCGILLNSKNEWAAFFTVDGILLGKQMSINPTVDRLYPTVYLPYEGSSVEANFGDNLVTKPFKYDIDKCAGLVFE